MTYGLSTGVFIEDGPAAHAIAAQNHRTTARSWRALDPERRLQLIDRMLKPANDLVDAYPLAL